MRIPYTVKINLKRNLEKDQTAENALYGCQVEQKWRKTLKPLQFLPVG